MTPNFYIKLCVIPGFEREFSPIIIVQIKNEQTTTQSSWVTKKQGLNS